MSSINFADIAVVPHTYIRILRAMLYCSCGLAQALPVTNNTFISTVHLQMNMGKQTLRVSMAVCMASSSSKSSLYLQKEREEIISVI